MKRFSLLRRLALLSLFDTLSTLIFSIDLLIAFIRCSSSVPIKIDEHVDDDGDDEHIGVGMIGFELLVLL